jgi:hypothetical protein
MLYKTPLTARRGRRFLPCLVERHLVGSTPTFPDARARRDRISPLTDNMPDPRPCAQCGRVGFVRVEHILKGGYAATEYYCGSCEHAWTVLDEGERRKSIRTRRRKAHTV